MQLLYNFLILITVTTTGVLISHFVFNKMTKQNVLIEVSGYLVSAGVAYILTFLLSERLTIFLEIISLSFIALALFTMIRFFVKSRREVKN
ncbi:hypothetical protein [Jeotgalibacillus sp. R-1-5s-1]|uniref:hypothetical protein n=1 Tax=Jeotgalibacillus sp. R-1-5s-1 TaxID=2555897 RepID=UPI00106AB43E|nr:hypothetical protein [Jeotgalibacillus sp. R-1-5s-1]TFD96613.1 hypothetical protein E2491_10840 [Jeotgalibacillus sp. R-1-5s-1]